MKTRCKAGDLAVIIRDVPSCTPNIGRIVAISGPAVVDPLGYVTWLIRPMTPEPYMINDRGGRFVRFMDFGESGIEHPDDWMMPLPPDKPEEQSDERETRVTDKEVTTCR